MLFTTITFYLFFLAVFILYWFVFNRNLKVQNAFLLICSYFFYSWWDWRFLLLLFFISGSNYLFAIKIQDEIKTNRRKSLFILGLAINLGTLAVFKYFNFFIDGIVKVSSLFGVATNIHSLNIILPIGISFYIFLSISYLIDVYQRKLLSERNIFNALLTFSFFPIILAGPIQRPISLLPQIKTKRLFRFTQIKDGLMQVIWGMFMKTVIADNCAVTVNLIFKDYSIYSGSTLLLGIFLFSVQIYSDFAGYSNIAIGIGKLLGFRIDQNFMYPYFSRNISDFWKRWNISLTNWFRDYLFLPVAYSVSRKIKSERLLFVKSEFVIYIIGILVTWSLTGLWHGANYTFILWGLYHGFFLVIHHLTLKPKKRLLRKLNVNNSNVLLTITEHLNTLLIIMLSWVFFRANSVEIALQYFSGIFSRSVLTMPYFPGIESTKSTLIIIFAFFIIEFFQRTKSHALEFTQGSLIKFYAINAFLFVIIWSIILLGATGNKTFIYFKF